MDIKKIIEENNLESEICEIRRHIHENPELSEQEFETGQYICEKLDNWGIEYQRGVAETGIVAIIRGDKPGKTVGLRADIDALPIREETGLPFSSKNDGVMHACGHDAHVAMLLGVCRIVSLIKDRINGNVKFFFQPAEETVGGAKRMIEEGCLSDPEVDCILGMHVEPAYNTGVAGIKYDKMYAASDMIDIVVKGKSAHGAHPNEGIDAIVAASNIVNMVQTVISRNVSPLNSAVCSFGVITGGNVRNQICDCVKMEGIVRTLDQETRLYVRNRIKKICETVADAMGADVELTVTESYGPLINSGKITDTVRKNAEKLLGKDNVVIEEYPDLSCEDFSYFAMKKPACYFHLGCYDTCNGPKVDLHHPRFTIDEKCLIIGVEMQVMNILSLIEE